MPMVMYNGQKPTEELKANLLKVFRLFQEMATLWWEPLILIPMEIEMHACYE